MAAFPSTHRPEVVLTLHLAYTPAPDASYIERIRQWCASRSFPLKFTIIDLTEEPDLAQKSHVYVDAHTDPRVSTA